MRAFDQKQRQKKILKRRNRARRILSSPTKMTLQSLADWQASTPESPPSFGVFDLNQFVGVCKKNWTKWSNELNAQRWITLELVAQNATPANVGLLAALETTSMQMQKVS